MRSVCNLMAPIAFVLYVSLYRVDIAGAAPPKRTPAQRPLTPSLSSRDILSSHQHLKKKLNIIETKYLTKLASLKTDLARGVQGSFLRESALRKAHYYLNDAEKAVCEYQSLVKRYKKGDRSVSWQEINRLRIQTIMNIEEKRDAIQKTLRTTGRQSKKLSPVENQKIQEWCSMLEDELNPLIQPNDEIKSIVLTCRNRLANRVKKVRMQTIQSRAVHENECQNAQQQFERDAEIKFKHWIAELAANKKYSKRTQSMHLPDKKQSTRVTDAILYSNRVQDKDCLRVLGLQADEHHSLSDITHAYRVLAKIYHPDKPCGNETEFKRIGRAYEVLTNRRS